MPHSSGGGSHSGGYHSGSSHGSGNRPSFSRRPFPGSSRYVYYHHHRPYILYAAQDPTAWKAWGWKTWLVILLIALGPVFGVSLLPKKGPAALNTNYDTAIVIRDGAELLSGPEEEEITDIFNAFLDESGITPALMTVYDDEWKGRGQSLKDYAFDLYVNTFSDERHWLIVYSEPEEGDLEDADWSWEGMQGDETDDIITTDLADDLGRELTEKLSQENGLSVGEAIHASFQGILPELMSPRTDGELYAIVITWAFVILLSTFIGWIDNLRRKKYRNAVSVSGEPVKASCPSCGAAYYTGTVSQCPKCGSVLAFSEGESFLKAGGKSPFEV